MPSCKTDICQKIRYKFLPWQAPCSDQRKGIKSAVYDNSYQEAGADVGDMADKTVPGGSDWNELAREVLDLWQDHLSAVAADPSARADMARMMAPASKAFADWTEMVQRGLNCNDGGKNTNAENSDGQSTEPDIDRDSGNGSGDDAHVRASAATDRTETTSSTSTDRPIRVDELAARLACLEFQLDQLRADFADFRHTDRTHYIGANTTIGSNSPAIKDADDSMATAVEDEDTSDIGQDSFKRTGTSSN